MEKGEEGTRSTQVVIAGLNEEIGVGLIQIPGTSHFENLYVVVRTNSINRTADVFEIQSDSENCSFGVDTEW